MKIVPNSVSDQFNSSPLAAAPVHVRTLKVLGKGRAATAELVEAQWPDGTRVRCVEKVFIPGKLTRLIYRLAFAAPFPYQSNRHAILACFYRRRVVATQLRQICNHVQVAMPRYVRFCRQRNAWILAAEWIDGRGPLIKQAERDEMSGLVHNMKRVERHLIDVGLHGTGWQVSPDTLVSTTNLLIKNTRLQLYVSSLTSSQPSSQGSHAMHDHLANSHNEFVIVDLESGIPAILLARYLTLGWKQATLFPFDELDEQRLLKSVATQSIPLSPGSRHDLESLVAETRLWKDSEIAPFRRPWQWCRQARRIQYRNATIERWLQQRLIDQRFHEELHNHHWLWIFCWVVSTVPFFGRILLGLLANSVRRKQTVRFCTHRRFRHSALALHRYRRTTHWMRESRIPRNSGNGLSEFLTNQLLSKAFPAKWHRWSVDRRQRSLNRKRLWLTLTSRSYQNKMARRTFRRMVENWTTRQWLGATETAQLLHNFESPDIGIYTRGFAKHLAVKTLTPFATTIKVTGLTATLAGGSLWYTIAPFFVLPLLRSLITLESWYRSRHSRTPHVRAFLIGWIPTFGSLAFVLQMFHNHPQVSEFILRDTASRIGQFLPVYGGPDSRTEHALVNFTTDAIAVFRKVASRPAAPIIELDIQTGPQDIQPTSDRKAA